MTTRRALSPRAAHAHAVAGAVLADAGSGALLDELVALAVARTGADAGQISMMTDRVVSLCPAGAFEGLVAPGDEHPFEETMCAHALRADAAVVIPDARLDQRVAGVGAVVRGELAAYLGVPVRTAGGDVVAVLCVFHRTAREWSAADQAQVAELAVRVGAVFEGAGLATAGS